MQLGLQQQQQTVIQWAKNSVVMVVMVVVVEVHSPVHFVVAQSTHRQAGKQADTDD